MDQYDVMVSSAGVSDWLTISFSWLYSSGDAPPRRVVMCSSGRMVHTNSVTASAAAH